MSFSFSSRCFAKIMINIYIDRFPHEYLHAPELIRDFSNLGKALEYIDDLVRFSLPIHESTSALAIVQSFSQDFQTLG